MSRICWLCESGEPTPNMIVANLPRLRAHEKCLAESQEARRDMSNEELAASLAAREQETGLSFDVGLDSISQSIADYLAKNS